MNTTAEITDVIGSLPYRMAFAGGWIDQPYISKHNPEPPGSMVVVAIEPTCRFMDRAGMATSTRRIARKLWNDRLPNRDKCELVQELYDEENSGKNDPSGSQDMVGLLFPGINRLDFDYNYRGGIFPVHIENNTNPEVCSWLENVINILPIAQRPPGYNPLETMNLDPHLVKGLGETGNECFDAISRMDINALGKSMNSCMAFWEAILPNTVVHSTIQVDLKGVLSYYQNKYPGAMLSLIHI